MVYSVFGLAVYQFSEFVNILSGFLIQPLFLALPPMFYLLFRWLVLPEYGWEGSDFKLLMPFVLVLLINTIVITYFSIDNIRIFSDEEGIGTISNYRSFSIISSSLTRILYMLQILVYGITVVFLILKKSKERKFNSENSRRSFIRNLWILMCIFLSFFLLSTIVFLINENSFFTYPLLIVITVCILFTGIFVLKISLVNEKD